SGVKFRRQHPIEGFIPDFVCIEKRLVVEVDGEYHNNQEQQEYDLERTEWLKDNKFRMVRFTNEEVLNKMDWVLEQIGNHLLSGSTSPSPLERESEGEVIKISSSILEIGGESDLDKGLQKAIDNKDSIGGIIECRVTGLPVALGEPFFDSVESLLGHIVFSIPAVRGIEFGTGFAAAKMFGSQHNDAILDMSGKTKSNHAG